jgi:hypothetical protein
MKNFKKIIIFSLALIVIAIPAFSFAQSTNTGTTTIGDIINTIGEILNFVSPVLLTLGVIFFMWGVVQYMIGGNEEAKKKGRDKIIYGIIGLVVIVSLWGLVGIVINTFGLSQTLPIANPTSNIIDTTTGSTGTIKTIGDVISRIGTILNSVAPILIALGVIFFIWGVVQYMIGGNEEAKKKGRDKIIYGLIGLVVIVSMWGLVGIIKTTFGLDNPNTPITNPASVVDTNALASKTSGCFGAYNSSGSPKLGDLLNYATCIISNSVIPLLFVLAIASFVWGVVQYVINDTEEAKKAKGRQFMLWGIIALAVMVSVWGLVGILRNTFGIENVLPQVKSQ